MIAWRHFDKWVQRPRCPSCRRAASKVFRTYELRYEYTLFPNNCNILPTRATHTDASKLMARCERCQVEWKVRPKSKFFKNFMAIVRLIRSNAQ